jgi:GTP cyclohydrolase IB
MDDLVRFPTLPDVQSRPDNRALAIDAVGIRRLRSPVTIRTGEGEQPTIATFSMAVALPAAVKGTHMSRFVELLEERTGALDYQGFRTLVHEMLQRLGAIGG